MALRQMGIARMSKYKPPVRSIAEGGKVGRPKLLHNGDGRGLLNHGGINIKGSAKMGGKAQGIQRQLRKQKYAANKTNAHKTAERDRNRERRVSNNRVATSNPNVLPGGAGGAVAAGVPTAGRPMHQSPKGKFQYGYGQWGQLTAAGKVNWNASPPKGKETVLGFNQVLPYLRSKGMITKMPTRQTTPPTYLDAIYSREMAPHNAALASAKAQYGYQSKVLGQDYSNQLNDLQLAQQQAVRTTNAGLSGNNLAGSGVSAAALGDLGSNFQDQLARTTQGNLLDKTNLLTQLQGSQREYNALKAGNMGVAKERWLAINDGQSLPKPQRGLWKQGQRQMRTTAQGIPMTWHATQAVN